jgi:hypothetical protein
MYIHHTIFLTRAWPYLQLSFTATTGLSTKFGPVATAGMQIVRQVIRFDQPNPKPKTQNPKPWQGCRL